MRLRASIATAGRALFEAAPPFARDVAISAYGYRLRTERYGGAFRGEHEAALARTFAPATALAAYRQTQWDKLMPVLSTVPAYAAWAGDEPNLDELDGLPIIRKQDVRGDLGRYLPPAWKKSNPVAAHTSGTTGAGFRFAVARASLQRQWAFWWRYRNWHGIGNDEWCGVFGGRSVVPTRRNRPPYWQINLPNRSIMFSQYHLSKGSARAYVREIEARGLRWLHGYPSVISLLARWGLELGLPPVSGIRWITTGAESLLGWQRRAIRDFFGVEPRQHYGLAEGVVNISECPLGSLHVDEDFSFVEMLPRRDGGDGLRLVGTAIDNPVLPLVRYDTGDVVEPSEDECLCGRQGRVVKSIDGRLEDLLMLSDGAQVGRIDHIFKDAVNIAEAQVIQDAPGRARFLIVKTRSYAADDENALRQEIDSRFGGRLTASIEYVQSIERTGAGKLRLVISKIGANQIAN